jgi:predicted restriction endonuclease
MFRNYQDAQYKQWRQKIKALDKYTCQWPGCQAKKKLQVHHIKKWSEFPGLRYHINNGITLCREHHGFIQHNEDSYAETFFKIISHNRSKT